MQQIDLQYCNRVVVECWIEVAMSQDGLLEDTGSQAFFCLGQHLMVGSDCRSISTLWKL